MSIRVAMAGAALWAPLCVVVLLAVPSHQQYSTGTPCLDAQRQQGPPIPGQRQHDCDAAGQFKPQQCHGSRCFCVDALGEQMTQFDTVGRHEAHLVSCGTYGHEWVAAAGVQQYIESRRPTPW